MDLPRWVLKTKRFWVLTGLTFGVVALFNGLFAPSFKSNFEAFIPYSLCTSSFFSYDNAPEAKDAFVFYSNKPKLKKEADTIEIFPTETYAFIDNTTYTRDSLLNDAVIQDGNFSVLKKGEIALPFSIKNAWNLSLGSVVYLDSIPVTLRFVFDDLNQIHDVELSSPTEAIFIGYDTLQNEQSQKYANFNAQGSRSGVILIDKIRNSLEFSAIGWAAGCFLADILAIESFAIFFRFKKEANVFQHFYADGTRNIFGKSLGVEVLYVLTPSAFGLAFLGVTKGHWILLAGLASVAVVLSVANSVIISQKSRRPAHE
jgi:hypothetical protein